MKKQLILILYLLALSIKTYSQEWVSIDGMLRGETVSLEVIQSNESCYQVKVNIHGLYDTLVQNGEGFFHMLTLDKGCNLSIVGSPSLPCISQLVAIPTGATMSVSIIEENWRDIEMGMIYPAQNHKSYLEENVIFRINNSVYQKTYIPPVIKVGQELEWRGIRHAGVIVCPFRYDPQKNTLAVLQQFILKVNFTKVKPISLKELPTRFGLFDNTVYIEDKPSSNIRNLENNYNYLIIVKNNSITSNAIFENSLKQFRIWKALKGFKTKVAYTDTIGTSSSEIKSFISQERSKGVTYVLFVGDDSDINLANVTGSDGSETIKSDYWYGCNTNSNLADISVGRFSISNVLDFKHMVEKTIRYETAHNSYSNNALLIAHYMNAPHPLSYQGCCNSIIQNHNNQMEFGTAYGASTSATNAYVINAINNGYNIVNYRGHAGVNYWGYGVGTPSWNYLGECFYSSEISNMDSSTCSVFFCVACNTGDISNSTDCMLETFTRSDHGAVAFLGATRPTQWDANSDYNKRLFDKLLNEHVCHLGDLNMVSHIANIHSYDSIYGSHNIASDNAYSYICGGDPTLEIWTDIPQSIGNVDVTSSNGNITISTGITGDYYIAISSMDGQRLDSISCSSPTCTIPIPTDKFLIAVNKHNKIPHIIYYDGVSNYIQNVSFTYDAYYEGNPMSIGDGVCLDIPDGEVTVKSGSKLVIKNGSLGVFIETGFECEKGAEFEIRNPN